MKFLNDLVDQFIKHKTTRMASSLAFYTSISLAPLLILFVSLSTALDFDYRQYFLNEIAALIGPQGSEIFEIIMKNADERSDLSAMAGVISTLIMLITSSFVFGDLRSSLNEIFDTRMSDVPKNEELSLFGQALCFLRDNIFHIGIVLSFLLILITSLLVSSFISSTIYLEDKNIVFAVNAAVSLFAYTLIFTLLFRYLPQRQIPWSSSLKGALGTSVFFLIGKELIGMYLGNNGISSAYGAAGSLVVFSTWMYYSAIIIFLGAEVIALKEKQKLGTFAY